MDANSQVPMQVSRGGVVDRLRGAVLNAEIFAEQPALRRALPAIGVMLAAAVVLIGWLLLSPADRVALQTGLPEAEKAQALTALTAAGFDAQLDPGTGALTVPADDYYRARMQLASEGLPQGTPDGLSTISEMPMGTSRQVETARLRRMLELDLARSITELQQVRSARVHLALPERTAFVREQKDARASVVVQLAPGMMLETAQVGAITSLVATAVPDMPRANISIVDQSGRLLTTESDDPVQMQSNRDLAYRLQMEKLYRERVLALLTPIVGMGNAAVEITLDMDFTRSEITREDYLPGQVLRSEQASLTENTGTQNGGIPGAVSNTPPAEPDLVTADETSSAAGATTTNRSSASTKNYEVSRRVETSSPATATITRVHAAILLHDTAAGVVPEGDEPAAPGLPVEQIEALTRSAVGFDAERGDVVIVSKAAFAPVPELITAAPWYTAQWLPDVGRILAQILVLAIVVLGVVRPLLSRLLPEVGAGNALAAGVNGEQIEVARGESLTSLRQRLDMSSPTEDPHAAITYEEKVDMIRQLASAETNRVAGVFKSMLSEGKEGDE